MGRIYRNPPLIEALCEFRFQNDTSWNPILPGLFYREVKDLFPIVREQNAFNIHFSGEQEQSAPSVQGSMTPKIQFFSEDETRLVQLSPGIFSINQLRPYPNWKALKTFIFEMLTVFSNVANPGALERIGLRYINRIEENKDDPTDTLLNYYPSLPYSVDGSINSLMSRVEMKFDKHNCILILTLALVPELGEDKSSYIFDLDCVTLDISGISISNASEWLEVAHQQIEDVFEASITDVLRQRFGEETS